ncbi:MAG: ribose 5-phosphate isomerase B [Rhizobiaceae bacterium]|jgi:ribose 5-phosphate isomerase B
MKIAIASDHAGYALKSFLLQKLAERDLTLLDLGCHSEAMVDYPDYSKRMAEALRSEAERGILICGSGIGISIAANRYSHVRAAVVSEPLSARLCREHNDANVLCLGGKLIGDWMALECASVFLQTPFAEGRHTPRVAMLGAIGA